MTTPRLAATLAALLAAAPVAVRAADGAEIYRRRCAGCHGSDGGGGSRQLPPLASPSVQEKSDQQLFDAVARGTADKKMPGFRGKLADGEIRAALAHVRALGK